MVFASHEGPLVRHATVAIPVCTWAEADGTFTNAKGIAQTTDEVVLAAAADAGGGGVVLDVLTHTTGVTAQVRCDWVVCAVPPAPEDSLWRELAGSGLALYRAGDCVAPRRAHAAVVEGHRVAVAL